MKIQRDTIQTSGVRTLSWVGDFLIDWANQGTQYGVNTEAEKFGRFIFPSLFDTSIVSEDGEYIFLYQKLGTKGVILKNGEIVREINRSYYYSDVYEYPAIFYQSPNGKTYLIHCPQSYAQIDFEDVDSGEIITKDKNRNSEDFFHSRFEISPNRKTLISKGWAWHPYDFVRVFDIEACIENPLLLDSQKFSPDVDGEICVASFINNSTLLIGSAAGTEPFDHEASEKLKPGQLAIWDIESNKILNPHEVDFEFGGNLKAFNQDYAWDLYDHPKIVDFNTGKVIDEVRDIFSGKQRSSIIVGLEKLPIVAFRQNLQKVAIVCGNKIEVLSV